tara:strand:+ start:375 stop:1052 length:678 start_codon:yes stop_codon:yes gene_type:complete
MKLMKKLKLFTTLAVSASLSFLTSQEAKADIKKCSDYPFVAKQAKFVPKGNGLFSLQATERQSVRSDSTNQMDKALKIAELRGRQTVSKFIQEQIEEKDDFNEKYIEKAVDNVNGVDWSSDEALELVTAIKSSSKTLRRGVIPIGSCYEPGKYVLVTVGIKPETIAAAGNSDASSGNPYSGFNKQTKSSSTSNSNSSPEGASSSQERGMQPFNTAPGYSGYDADF